MRIATIDIERGMLACDEALSKVQNEIEVLAINKQVKVLKVIHGYGSKGTGGKIKHDLLFLLQNLLKQKKIKGFAPNERFTQQNEKYSNYFKLYPELLIDSDLQNLNPGITLIFL